MGPGYTKPPPEAGPLNFLHACKAGGHRGREVGARRGVGGLAFVAPPRGGGGGKSLPCVLQPSTRGQPTACTLALWWLKFGLTGEVGGER